MKHDYIRTIMDNVNFKEGRMSIERILSFLYMEQRSSNKIIARTVNLPIPVITAIKKEAIRLGIMEQLNGIQLTQKGKEYVETECGYLGLNINLYKDLMDDNFCEKMILNLCEKYQSIYNNRPQVDVTVDQAKGTIETAFKRALLCLKKHTLIGKNILCVGDDDLVSIALGLLLKELYSDASMIKNRICVFDIDDRYIDYIASIAKQYGLVVECLKIDLKDPLPLSYSNSFDCFFTDPPYTIEGMSLFLSRGISALKKECGLHIFLSYGQKPVDEMREIQEIVIQQGLIVSEIIKSFNEYEGASSLGNVSQMIILESSEQLREIIPDDLKYDQQIYTAELRARHSIYTCKNCKEQYILGQTGGFSTIEQLKANGCLKCGKHLFELKRKNYKPALIRKKNALGTHILADFYGCDSKLLKDVNFISQAMHTAAEKAKATIVYEKFHTFNPWGVSGAIIIQESHLTIHTWPEHKYAAVDLFTCGDSLDLWSALEYLREILECQNIDVNSISRGLLRKEENNVHF